MRTTHPAETTRRRILETAFQDFYRNGYQGGSINRIVKDTRLTKGALFHHFASKQELGYAVVDEVIWPQFKAMWIDPLEQSEDPISVVKRLMLHVAEKGPGGGMTPRQGCPVNNLAQEMSPLDEGFRRRLDDIYTAWRLALKTALARAIKAGKVKKNVVPAKVAALLVAALTGIMGNVKNSQNEELLREAGGALLDYLDSLRA